jgi:hypothetical protein
MSDEAQETVASWLGARQPREVMAAIIFSGTIVSEMALAARDGKDQNMVLRKLIEVSVDWADAINTYCKANPPKT